MSTSKRHRNCTFTEVQDQWLVDHYATCTPEEAEAALGKKWTTAANRAFSLGLRRPRKALMEDQWLPKLRTLLAGGLTYAECARALDKSYKQVEHAARKHGLKSNSKRAVKDAGRTRVPADTGDDEKKAQYHELSVEKFRMLVRHQHAWCRPASD